MARANGLAVVEYTLPSGVSRTIEIAGAVMELKALADLISADEGDVIFQTVEFRP